MSRERSGERKSRERSGERKSREVRLRRERTSAEEFSTPESDFAPRNYSAVRFCSTSKNQYYFRFTEAQILNDFILKSTIKTIVFFGSRDRLDNLK